MLFTRLIRGLPFTPVKTCLKCWGLPWFFLKVMGTPVKTCWNVGIRTYLKCDLFRLWYTFHIYMCHVLTYYICIWIGRVCIYRVCIEVVCVYIFAQYIDCCMYTYSIQNTHTHIRTHAHTHSHTHSHTHTHIGSASTHQSKWILPCSQMLLLPPTNI